MPVPYACCVCAVQALSWSDLWGHLVLWARPGQSGCGPSARPFWGQWSCSLDAWNTGLKNQLQKVCYLNAASTPQNFMLMLYNMLQGWTFGPQRKAETWLLPDGHASHHCQWASRWFLKGSLRAGPGSRWTQPCALANVLFWAVHHS